MHGLIINTALTLTRSVQKNLSLILSFLAFFLFICSLGADDPFDCVALGHEAGGPLVLMIHLKSAQGMGVAIPDDLKSQAKIIGDKR